MTSTTTHTELLHRWPVHLGFVIGAAALFDQAPWAPSGPWTWLLPVLALVYLGYATLHHKVQQPGVLRLQLIGFLVFTAIAATALVIDPEVGRYVVAAGWLAHAGWDVYHHRSGKVVARWYAEFCAVLDVMVALSIILAGRL